MGALRVRLLVVTTILIAGAASALGQDVESDRSTLEAAMKRSREITKDVSYRTTTKVESGASPTTKDWAPYSSWRIENVYPNRSHVKYGKIIVYSSLVN